MALSIEKRFSVDLDKPLNVQYGGGLMFTGDAGADTFEITLYKSGEAYAPGGSVALNCIRADGNTVTVAGSISGNTATATLTQACCAIPGPLSVVMQIISGGNTGSVFAAVYTVMPAQTGEPIDPGTTIPDIAALIAQIDAAVDSIPADYSELLAAIAPTFSTSTAYAAGDYVWYDGDLYKFTAAHSAGAWTGSDVTVAVFATDISELKSAIDALDDRADMTTTAVPNAQIVDASTLTHVNAGGTWGYRNFNIPFPGDGVYYNNPIKQTGYGNYLRMVTFLDGNGDAITITRDSDSATIASIDCPHLSTLTFSGTALTLTNYNTYDRFVAGQAYNHVDYTLSAVPSTMHVDTLYTGNAASADKLPAGVTKDVWYTTYKAYGGYDYTYSDELTTMISDTVNDATADIIEDVGELQDAMSDVPNTIKSTIASEYLDYRADMVSIIGVGNVQLCDISQYEIKNYGTSFKYYQNVRIDFSQNGVYYSNPIGKAYRYQMKFYDASDNLLTITGVSGNALDVAEWDEIERVNDTTIVRRQYTYEANFYNRTVRAAATYTLSGTVSYAIIGNLRTKSFDASTDIGVTVGEYSRVYIPYGINHTYNPELPERTWDYFVDNNYFYNVPAKRLNPWMQRSYALTNNLLDDRKINWIASGNYYTMKQGETVPVTGGKTIICNKGMATVKTYNSSGTETSLSNIGAWTPVTLANDVVSMRFDVGVGSGTGGIPAGEYQPVMLYYVDDNRLYPQDDVDVVALPMAQINGWDINKNVYDYAVPDEDSEVVRIIKTFAIREVNRRQDAYRIGTFNIYVNNTRTNRPTIKKELATYGLDVCCFQEARLEDDSGHPINIGDYLKGWQFQYCNTNASSGTNGRSITSALQIISSTEVTFTANTSNSYLKCVIQMPRYKDYADGLTTLSLYTYHGIVSSAETRAAEVTQMLAAIAEDTSDFIIVTGDTNDFSTNKDIWTMFNAAGLTPVHNGESETVTARNESIDNIFISEHCSCAYYNVINSGEWMYTIPGTTTTIPVSDHDLLYADIVFDFAAVIAARS